jgi:3-oxoacyl-[acyl-carrier protein] reductase
MANLPCSITLHGLTALVTGGSRGIGKGISLELARRGANVAVVYVNPTKSNAANQTVAEILALGVKAVAIQADLRDTSTYERIVKETLNGLGTDKIHILGTCLKLSSTYSAAEGWSVSADAT